MSPTRTATDLVVDGVPVRLVRSRARTRTVSAAWRQGRLQINVPARLSRAEERRWVAQMVERLGARARGPVPSGDPQRGAGPRADPGVDPGSGPGADSGAGRGLPELEEWARRLSVQHLGGAARPVSVTWSARQRQRWGSCTPGRGTIRLSTQLRGMPEWVVGAVLLHELAHLLESGHGPAFQALVDRYPRYREAMAFLDGVTFARNGPAAPTPEGGAAGGLPADDLPADGYGAGL
ncbi:M48 family metallopeptidase [Micrococcus sp.]|uniref:M48 family metallopeptidase n=1 Tax=Micrococcus sp. TaxID=1271 RepID=UPI002A91303B|nr:SprT-like domain-containing protein [Micrococcus sp.]MDY6055150.1 YgjP-like metallopeptidase domain-containing protein [Micrococcus sp.]